MAGEKQMVPGFNHNVKHKGIPYHVQTEDSGIDTPRIITHLFVGGNIIASKKTSYADIVGAENLAQVVRQLMEEQHKEMLRNLISGVYDDTGEALANARAFQPGQIVPEQENVVGEDRPRPAPPPAPQPPPIARPAPQIPRQAAAAPQRRPERPAATPVRATPAATPLAARPARAVPAPPTSAPMPAVPAPGKGPAAASAQPRDSVEALFGEDLISEKSLDEVILSYLAEDLAQKR